MATLKLSKTKLNNASLFHKTEYKKKKSEFSWNNKIKFNLTKKSREIFGIMTEL